MPVASTAAARVEAGGRVRPERRAEPRRHPGLLAQLGVIAEPQLDDLDEAARDILRRLQKAVDDRPKDWDTFMRQAREFHVRNAENWANKAVGVDLTRQIDPPSGSRTKSMVSA